MTEHSVRLHRVLRSSPDRVYRAFLDPDAWVKWLPPHGFTGKVELLEPRVGGRYRMAFTHLASGQSHGFGGEYLELVPGQTLRYNATFDAPGLAGTLQTTVTLRAVSCGVELNVLQEGIPEAIPLESCYLGWQQSLQLLGLLVETDTGSGPEAGN